MPQEFTTVTASSYDAAGLATKLTEKSAEGWDVVGVVGTGTEIAAILSRAATGAATANTSASVATDPGSGSTPTYAAAAPAAAASEPSGWGTTASSSPAGGYSASSAPSGSYGATAAAADPSSGYSAASQPAAAAAPAASGVPAGWYADPAGRFDLRYWDGSTWTEHVSRAGQQFTDPPVA